MTSSMLPVLSIVYLCAFANAQSSTTSSAPTSTSSLPTPTDAMTTTTDNFIKFWQHNWYYFLAAFIGFILPLMLWIIFGPIRKYLRKRKRNSTPVLWGNIGEETYAVRPKEKARGSQSTISTMNSTPGSTRNSSMRNLDLEKFSQQDMADRRQTQQEVPTLPLGIGRNDSTEAGIGLGSRKSVDMLEVGMNSPYGVVRLSQQAPMQPPQQMTSVYHHPQRPRKSFDQSHYGRLSVVQPSPELPPMPRMSFQPTENYRQQRQTREVTPPRHQSLQYSQTLRYQNSSFVHGRMPQPPPMDRRPVRANTMGAQSASYQAYQQPMRANNLRVVNVPPTITIPPPMVQQRQLLYSPPFQYPQQQQKPLSQSQIQPHSQQNPEPTPFTVGDDLAKVDAEEYKRIASEENRSRNFSWNMPRRSS